MGLCYQASFVNGSRIIFIYLNIWKKRRMALQSLWVLQEVCCEWNGIRVAQELERAVLRLSFVATAAFGLGRFWFLSFSRASKVPVSRFIRRKNNKSLVLRYSQWISDSLQFGRLQYLFRWGDFGCLAQSNGIWAFVLFGVELVTGHLHFWCEKLRTGVSEWFQ